MICSAPAYFQEALLLSELCKPDQRPDTVEEYFDVYHNTLQSLADEFAPVWQVAIRRQRLTICMDEQYIASNVSNAGTKISDNTKVRGPTSLG